MTRRPELVTPREAFRRVWPLALVLAVEIVLCIAVIAKGPVL